MYCVLAFYLIDDHALCINTITQELKSIRCDVVIVINVFI